MKKLLTMVAVLATACVMFLGCPTGSTPKEENPAGNTPEAPKDNPYEISITQDWQGPTIEVGDDWKSLNVTFADDFDTESWQFTLISDVKNAAITAYEAYFSDYLPIEKGANAIVIAEADEKCKALDTGVYAKATKVAKIQIQNKADGTQKVGNIKRITYTDKTDVEKSIELQGGWGCDVTAK